MSKTNIPCDTVRDLFPSYIDKLTSDTTNQLIQEHISDCAECSDILSSMRAPEADSLEAVQKETKEIDFLKKNKRRNLKIIIGSVAGAIALVIVILLLKAFIIGEANYSGMVATRVEVSGSDVTLTAVPIDSIHAVSNLTFEEEDGVVTVRARAVLMSFLHRGDLRRKFTASQSIRRIQAWAVRESPCWITSGTRRCFFCIRFRLSGKPRRKAGWVSAKAFSISMESGSRGV